MIRILLTMRYSVILLHLLLLPQLILSQSIQFRKITVADGLSNNFVHTIHKDQTGFIWFGTLDGLDRFDGVEIRSYSDRFPDGHQRVNTIIDDPRNGLWVGTDKGLLYWDYISDDFLSVPLTPGNTNVTTLLALPGDSSLLVGTSMGIYIMNTRNFEQLDLDVKIENPYTPTKAVYDGNNKIWISSSSGLIELNLDGFSTDVYFNDLGQRNLNNFSSLAIFKDNLILGTVTLGLFVFDVTEKNFTPYENIGNNAILTLDYSEMGILYVATDGNGLIMVNTKDGNKRSFVKDLSDPFSLNSNAVYSFLVEDNGRYWVGTYSGGVNFTTAPNNLFQIYNDEKYLGENSIRSLYYDDEENKFIGTREGLIVFERSGKKQLFTMENSEYLQSNVILSFAEMGDDVFVGTFRGGISKYNKKNGSLELNPLDGISLSASVYAFDHDKKGNLIIGEMAGIRKINPSIGFSMQYNENNSELVDNRVITLFSDSKERLWVGSSGSGSSLYAFEDNELVRLETEFDLSEYKAVSFFEDHRGDIWLATEGSGLCVIGAELDYVNCYSTNEGLTNNSVTAITEAPENTFWITTLKGLCRFDRKTNRFFNYSLSDGLPSLVFNRGSVINNYKSDGKLWFGSERGLVSLYPDSLLAKTYLEKVVLTDLFLSGQLIDPNSDSFLSLPLNRMEEIHIKAGQGSVGFRFVALNYYNPGDNEYAYRLKGLHEEWKFTNDNSVTFPELKPGIYTFEVQLSQGDLTEFQRGTSLQVIIEPLFYQKTSFKVTGILFIISTIIFIIIIFRRLKLKAKTKAEKTTLLRYESSHLSSMRRTEIEKILINYVEENKPYLDPDLKLNDLAKSIDCSPHHVSQVINQNLNKSYYEFINFYRINAVKERMSDSKYDKYTLLAIGQECGFRSKTSFYRAFKNLTGQTPYDYQVQIQKEKA